MTSQKTTNFGFPLFAPNDPTSWLVDFNGAMTDIDKAAQLIKTQAENAEAAATGASGSVAQINQQLVNINNSLANVIMTLADMNQYTSYKEGGISFILRKGLNILHIYGAVNKPDGQPANTVIATLPPAFRPTSLRTLYYIVGLLSNYSAPSAGYYYTTNATLTPDGKVTIINSIPAGGSFHIQSTISTEGWFN